MGFRASGLTASPRKTFCAADGPTRAFGTRGAVLDAFEARPFDRTAGFVETFCFPVADLALTLDLAGFAFVPLAFAAARLTFLPAVLVLALDVFAFARGDFGFFAAGLVGFRLAAGFAFRAAFREGARPAAGLPRVVVFAMILASIPPAGIARRAYVKAAARLQCKRAF